MSKSTNTTDTLSFVCDNQILKDAISATSKEMNILIPYWKENKFYLVISNSLRVDSLPSFAFLSQENFRNFKMLEPTNVDALNDNDLARNIPVFAFETKDVTRILSKMKGAVKIVIKEHDNGYIMVISDESTGKTTKYDGKIILKDEFTIEGDLGVTPTRRKSAFVELIAEDHVFVQKFVLDAPHILLKLVDKKFDPLSPGDKGNITALKIWKDKSSYIVKFHTMTIQGNNYISESHFNEVINKLDSPIEPTEDSTRIHINVAASAVETTMKHHLGDIQYLLIRELEGNEEVPFLFHFSSEKLYPETKGKLLVYTVMSPQTLTDQEVVIVEETPAEVKGAEIEEVGEDGNLDDFLN